MKNIKKIEWFTLIGLILLIFVPCVGGLLRLVDLNVGLAILPENNRVLSSPIPAIFHIVSSTFYCIMGIFQFMPSIRNFFPIWHRIAGRLLVGAGVLSALSGLWMTHFYDFPDHLQGTPLYLVRIVVSVLMTTYLLLGVRAILINKIVQHEAWMVRAYALGLGAGTQVVITIPFFLTVGEPSGITRDILMMFGWWINVVVGEYIINKKTKYL